MLQVCFDTLAHVLRLALTRCRGRHIMMGYLMNPRLGQEHMDEMKKKNQVRRRIRFVSVLIEFVVCELKCIV